MDDKLIFKSFTLGEWMTNGYFIGPADEKRGWVFDPGFSPEPMIDFLKAGEITVEKIIFTHAHLDHIAGAALLLEIWPKAEVLIHEAEISYSQDPSLNLSTLAGRTVIGPVPGRGLTHGEILGKGVLSCRVIHTPGHSPGGACFYFESAGILIAGDTLFKGSVGRYDFPTSDGEALFEGIQKELMPLPDETVVYPGHGPDTTIGYERTHNPYL